MLAECSAEGKPVLLVINELPIFLKRMHRRDGNAERVDEFLSWLRGTVQLLGDASPVLTLSGSIGLEPLVRRLGLADRINHFFSLRLGPWRRETRIDCFKPPGNDPRPSHRGRCRDDHWCRALVWIGLAARAVALSVPREAGSMDAFRAAFARFPAVNEVMTSLMIRLVLNLVAVGAREEELAEVLAEDTKKSRSRSNAGRGLERTPWRIGSGTRRDAGSGS